MRTNNKFHLLFMIWWWLAVLPPLHSISQFLNQVPKEKWNYQQIMKTPFNSEMAFTQNLALNYGIDGSPQRTLGLFGTQTHGCWNWNKHANMIKYDQIWPHSKYDLWVVYLSCAPGRVHRTISEGSGRKTPRHGHRHPHLHLPNEERSVAPFTIAIENGWKLPFIVDLPIYLSKMVILHSYVIM